ncbi:antibiotic biosynthesis monooxygenase family protein [Paenibacillus arenilitoris]|uniref:Antibiotic biosynthesis monooxygenase n=1 Tax=Paenibacillus arenilitoris TaxID=2772299 RepID=A0A927CLZ4_9BACL|nr:antibiotic biosynthesis monooxygenase [Paenibacillus arenilitoris]MBD2869865.1 antibiotic biosynthesis monooxygenase [Paenibacillus arenilitoris]
MQHQTSESSGTYYAVIFSSQRTSGDNGYGEMADLMERLAAEQPGFIGAESVRDHSGSGITVSYWESLEAIGNWKKNEEHRAAQEKGRQSWYQTYTIRICKVEREYSFNGER